MRSVLRCPQIRGACATEMQQLGWHLRDSTEACAQVRLPRVYWQQWQCQRWLGAALVTQCATQQRSRLWTQRHEAVGASVASRMSADAWRLRLDVHPPACSMANLCCASESLLAIKACDARKHDKSPHRLRDSLQHSSDCRSNVTQLRVRHEHAPREQAKRQASSASPEAASWPQNLH